MIVAWNAKGPREEAMHSYRKELCEAKQITRLISHKLTLQPIL